MFAGRRISVILPTYNEVGSIRQCVEDFHALGVVDEIIVVNNNAPEEISRIVRTTPAREVREPAQGYGHAIRRGLAEATGDLLVVCEPDDTFRASDLHKLLAYCDDNAIVFGSRTAREFIWAGANMGPFLRWGNYAVAKELEFLFNTNSLTDVGCTFRLIRRDAYEAMRPFFSVGKSHFGLEMMVLAARMGLRFVQIPVNYGARTGASTITGSFWKAFRLGMVMIATILRHRLRGRLSGPPPPRGSVGGWALTAWPAFWLLPLLLVGGLALRRGWADLAAGDCSAFVLLAWNDMGAAHTPVSLSTQQWHPYLYVGLLRLAGRLAGPELARLRLPGLLCVAADLLLVWALARRVIAGTAERRVGALIAVAFCCASPLMPFQAMLTDIDGSVLTTAILAAALAACRVLGDPAASLWPLAWAFAGTLWCKLTTPLLVPAALACCALAGGAGNGPRRALRGLLAGAGIFAATWLAANLLMGLPPGAVFRRLAGAFLGHAEGQGVLRALSQAAGALAHLGLAPVAVALVSAGALLGRRGERRGPLAFLAWLALGILGGYLLMGRLVFGVPKYHPPFVPLAGVLVAAVWAPRLCALPRRGLGAGVLAVTLLAALAAFLAPDPAHALYRDAKRLAEAGLSPGEILGAVLPALALPFLGGLMATALLLSRPHGVAAALALALAAGLGAGESLRRSRAGGMVTYAYGATGGREVLDRLARAGARTVLSIDGGLMAPLQPPGALAFSCGFSLADIRTDPGPLLRRVEAERPDALLLGPALLPLGMREAWEADPRFPEALEGAYARARCGDFELWLRRRP